MSEVIRPTVWDPNVFQIGHIVKLDDAIGVVHAVNREGKRLHLINIYNKAYTEGNPSTNWIEDMDQVEAIVGEMYEDK